jgi:hypothetical protein
MTPFFLQTQRLPVRVRHHRRQQEAVYVSCSGVHGTEPRLHYEVSRAPRHSGFELGLHFEARDRALNHFLLNGFRRHLLEIKDTLGDTLEAEMWDKGWAKVYEVYPEGDLTPAFQEEIGRRLAAIICCLQPIFIDLRQE